MAEEINTTSVEFTVELMGTGWDGATFVAHLRAKAEGDLFQRFEAMAEHIKIGDWSRDDRGELTEEFVAAFVQVAVKDIEAAIRFGDAPADPRTDPLTVYPTTMLVMDVLDEGVVTPLVAGEECGRFSLDMPADRPMDGWGGR